MSNQSSTPKLITKKHIARLERERRQTRIILAVAITGILIVAALLVYGALRSNIVASVNGEKITAGEWQERVKFQRVQMINVYNQYAFYQQNFNFDYSQQMQQIQLSLQGEEGSKGVGEQVLNQMVDEALIRQEAEKRGITVSAEEVEASVQENFQFFPDGTPTPTITPADVSFPTLTSQQLTLYPSTPTPTEMLTSTPEPTATLDPLTPTATVAPATPTLVPATPYTLEGFKTEYGNMLKEFEKYTISEATIRSVYEAQILRKKLTDDVAKEAPHTEEQVWARHILVETEEEANDLYKRLKNGADFAQLARSDSKDTGSGANGGDLGWFGKGAMVPEFEEAAFKLKVGQISEPVKSQFGYHIIQILGHQEVPLDATQYEQKKETDFSDWLTLQREEANIKTFDVWKEKVPTEPSLQTQQQ